MRHLLLPTLPSTTTSENPGRAFWGADDEEVSEGGIPRVIVLGYDGLLIQPVAPPSPDYIPGPEDPQTSPVPQDEDECEPMFIQAHDPDYVPEPIYPDLNPDEDPRGYEDDETRGWSRLTIAMWERLARCTAPHAHSPPLPPSLSIPPPVDRRDDIPESEQPPRKRLYLSTIGSRYEIGECAEETATGLEMLVIELAELHERDTQDLYALLEDAQDSRRQYGWWRRRPMLPESLGSSIGLVRDSSELQTICDPLYAHEPISRHTRTQLIETTKSTTVRAPRPEGRDSPSHQRHDVRDEHMQTAVLALQEQQRRAR
ncbi:hypothetical protein Tco_1092274 [Tanacetum coccineum]|uniref:Uncharacterized protein n=1 Tax=Tanacetum coccineum TaxID=301880 RepID=A0ABQ5I9G5_9ASTR